MTPEHRRAFQIVVWSLFTLIAVVATIGYLIAVAGALIVLGGLQASS